jgi:catechol 2,3-dioxygenase-like lactoylglutathione lyase family enzyme
MTGERFDHVGLSVESLDAMQEWYERALGFTSEFAFAPTEDLRIAMLVHPSGARLELFERSGSTESPIPPDPLRAPSQRGLTHWSLCVDDLDATHERLVRAGASSVWGPRPSPEPGVRMAFVADPEGHLIELLER